MKTFNLPDLGEGLQEAEIVTWHVNEGDHVVVDQPLVSVETDKAVVEVPSPWSGRIARLFGAKGDLVKVGAPLVEFAEPFRVLRGECVCLIQLAQRSIDQQAKVIVVARQRECDWVVGEQAIEHDYLFMRVFTRGGRQSA